MAEPLSKEFLVERGYCCGAGCKNCPYDPKHVRAITKLAETFQQTL